MFSIYFCFLCACSWESWMPAQVYVFFTFHKNLWLLGKLLYKCHSISLFDSAVWVYCFVLLLKVLFWGVTTSSVIEIAYFFPQYCHFVLCVIGYISISWNHLDSYIVLKNWYFIRAHTSLFLQRFFLFEDNFVWH